MCWCITCLSKRLHSFVSYDSEHHRSSFYTIRRIGKIKIAKQGISPHRVFYRTNLSDNVRNVSYFFLNPNGGNISGHNGKCRVPGNLVRIMRPLRRHMQPQQQQCHARRGVNLPSGAASCSRSAILRRTRHETTASRRSMMILEMVLLSAAAAYAGCV